MTANEALRGGKVIPLKSIVDDAVSELEGVRRVFVARRTGAEVRMQAGRDIWLEEVRKCCAENTPRSAMLILHTYFYYRGPVEKSYDII